MTSSLDLIRGRQVVQTLTNQSGGAIIAGDVVIISTANDESFTTTTSAAYNSTRVGIAQESIAAAASGRILLEGYAPLVNVSASATRGHYLLTHTVAKQATSQAGYAAGAFGQILKAGTTPSAMIFPVAQVGSAGVLRSGSTTDGHLAVWNGSNAESLKDGGVAAADGTWTDYSATSTIVGWSSFTAKSIYYKQVGKTVFVAYLLVGTSNSTTTTFTVPAAAAAAPVSLLWTHWTVTGVTNTIGIAQISGGSSTVSLYNTAAGGNWPNNGDKQTQGQFWYVAA